MDANGNTIGHYTVYGNSPQTIPLSPVGPTADVALSNPNSNPNNEGLLSGSCYVTYAITVIIPTITLTGGIVVTNPDKSTTIEYLVGQQLGASLSYLSFVPLTATSYSWSASGGGPFTAFNIAPDGISGPPGTGSGHVVPLVQPVTTLTYTACFAKAQNPVVITVDAHLAVPPGCKPPGGIDITVTQPFATVAPVFTVKDWAKVGGALALNGTTGWKYSGSFDRGDGTKGAFGVKATVSIPKQFSPACMGWWDWAQIIDASNYTSTVGGAVEHWYNMYTIGGVTTYFNAGHDSPFPYDTVYPDYTVDLILPGVADHWVADPTPLPPNGALVTGMEDGLANTFPTSATECDPNFALKDYAMFLPSGVGSQHVPLWEADWSFSGVFKTDDNGNWSLFGTPIAPPPTLNANPDFPDWMYTVRPLGGVWGNH